MIGNSILKNSASALLGILIGLDPISGKERYTFGSFELSSGIGLVPVMIDIFGLGSVLIQMGKKSMRLALKRMKDRVMTMN